MNGAGGQATGIDPARWQKVFIIGGPGSGKTRLGRIVARAIEGPLYELDAIGYEGGSGAERSLADRLRDVDAIARRGRWVAEGSYIDWTGVLADAADGIVWLDPPWRVARRRIVTRHLEASLRRSNRHAGWRNLWRFVGHCRGYYTGPDARRLRTAAWIDGGYAGKTVICRTDREVAELVASIRARE